MPLIVGLGNPGDAYSGTKHNIGFEIINRLSETLKIRLVPEGGLFRYAVGRHRGRKVILMTPQTYMNNSGKAVLKACHVFDIQPIDTFICSDDINLPAGKIRIRKNGGHGGHNGLKNIIEKLQTKEFPRLRFGIGSDFRPGQQSEYVLSPFPPEVTETVEKSITHARDAALCFVREGIVETMNKYN